MLAVVLVVTVICGVAGHAIGRTKGRGTEGALLGIFLGVIGLLIVAFMRPRYPADRQWGPGPGQFGRGPEQWGPPPGTWGAPGWTPPAPPPDGDAPGAQSAGDAYVSDDGTTAPGWVPDPTGRYQFRWWDGMAYTHHVSTDGVSTFDPLPVAP